MIQATQAVLPTQIDPVRAAVKRRRWKLQSSVGGLFLAMAFVAVCIVSIGRLTKNGTVYVHMQHDPYVQALLSDMKVYSWESVSSEGYTSIHFPERRVFVAVDDALANDAKQWGYPIVIEYHSVLPVFSWKQLVNVEPGDALPGDALTKRLLLRYR